MGLKLFYCHRLLCNALFLAANPRIYAKKNGRLSNNYPRRAENKGVRRVCFICSLALYNIFMPFVLLNCTTGEDNPYIIQADQDGATGPTLEECEAREFLTEDCVEVMQSASATEEQTETSIDSAYDALDDFESCYAYTGEDDAVADVTDTAEDTVDCTATVATVLAGAATCSALDEIDRGLDCQVIDDTVSGARELCAEIDATVTTAFCGLVG